MLLLLACSTDPQLRAEAGRPLEPEWLREREEQEEREEHRGRAPTELASDDPDAEERANEGRKAWFAKMHRAPPGVDWQAVERANGLAQVRRRAAMALEPPAPSAPRWVERGPTNQAGRTHVARPSSDGTYLYVGSALGGLWRGSPDGEGWEPLGDSTYGGVHFLEVIAGDPDVIVTCTDGGLVLRSTDAGTTWETPEGLDAAWWARRLTQAPDGTLFLVTAANEGIHLLRSADAGATWEVVHDFGTFYGDVWVARTGSDERIWLLDRDALRVSGDDGDTWEDVAALPATADSGEIVGSEAGAPALYAVLGGVGFRSDDAGLTWTSLGTLSDYWGGSLAASIVDSSLFAYGGVELHISTDAGVTYEIANAWWDYYPAPDTMLHADVQGIDVLPDGSGGETWYIDTDGGTYRSADGLLSVENLVLSGLRVGQYYDVLTSSENPENVAIGAQDQGYQVTNGIAQDDDVWEVEQVISGDYGHLTSGDGTHEWVFSVYPGVILAQHGEDVEELLWADFPATETVAAWLPGIVADPDEPRDFYFPADHLWRYEKTGRETWTPTIWSEQDFRVASDEYLTVVAFSPADSDRVFALTSYGRAWWSDDHGVTWTMSTQLVADDNWYYGQAIAPSLTDRDVVTIGGSGYGGPSVYRSTDGGQTWAPWDQGLPDTLVYTLVEASDRSGTIFAGTQTAAYRRDPDDTEWEDITTEVAPVTIYWDAEALADENTIRFATYGRGIWDYQLDPDGAGCFPGDDADGDGSDCTEDCDDTDAAVFPGAEDTCDGVDADCDPATPDEGDADGDGVVACLDCDDLDPARTPGAEDLCGDGVDADCDGADPECDPVHREADCGCDAGATEIVWLGLLAPLLRRRR